MAFRIAPYVITALLIAFLLLHPVYAEETVEEKLARAYSEVYDLARKGVDVRDLVHRLDYAEKLLEKGDEAGAEEVIDGVIRDADRLEQQAGYIVFWKNFWKAATIALLIALPIASYLLLPRIYLELWYRTRRKWVVEK